MSRVCRRPLCFFLPLYVAAFCLGVLPAHATNHALIMGISHYSNPQAALPGVTKDMDVARQIAASLNVPPGNIVQKFDQDMSLAAFESNIRTFSKRLQPGDNVFVYFSGHGVHLPKSGDPGVCEQSLLTQDMKLFPKETLQKELENITSRANKVFVLLDTCHSGGVLPDLAKGTRAIGKRLEPTGERAKYFLPKSAGSDRSTCTPSNVLYKGTRDLNLDMASKTPNYYLLAAAQPEQIAILMGKRGSLATVTVGQCMGADDSADTNNDGVLTLDEVRACAQLSMDNYFHSKPQGKVVFADGTAATSQTLSSGAGVGGNVVVSFPSGPPQLGVNQEDRVNDPQQPRDASGHMAAVAVSQTAAPSTRINSSNLLDTLYRGRDVKRRVSLTSSKQYYVIDRDHLEIGVRSSHHGYLTIFTVGSSGRIYQIFPNRFDRDNRVFADQEVRLPRETWRMPANGPAGTDRFLALVSETPERFANTGVPAGPFRAIENDAAGAKAIVERLLNPDSQLCRCRTTDGAVATSDQSKEIIERQLRPATACKPVASFATRDFGVVANEASLNPCSTSYAAGLIDVQEITAACEAKQATLAGVETRDFGIELTTSESEDPCFTGNK